MLGMSSALSLPQKTPGTVHLWTRSGPDPSSSPGLGGDTSSETWGRTRTVPRLRDKGVRPTKRRRGSEVTGVSDLPLGSQDVSSLPDLVGLCTWGKGRRDGVDRTPTCPRSSGDHDGWGRGVPGR